MTAAVDHLHTPMPVILNADKREGWLAVAGDAEIGSGARLGHHPVPRFGMKDDGPELIEAVRRQP